jgi:hypothetical protein
MGIARPVFTGARGTRRRADQGGGGGGGTSNPWKDWQTADLADIASGTGDWKIIKGSTPTTIGATVTHESGLLVVNFPGTGSTYNIRETGSTNNGIWIIKKIHIDPWEFQAKPTGENDYRYRPESTLLKVEMGFNDAVSGGTGPIDGVTGTSGSEPYGQQGGVNLSAACGISMYSSDQSGNPALPGADSYAGAYVMKNLGAATSSSTSGNMFKAGSASYNIKQSTNYSSVLWKGQSGSSATEGFDAVVFHAGFNTVKGPYTSVQVLQGGGYSTTNPFGDMVTPAYSYAGNSSKVSNDRYLHVAMWFGAETNAVRGGVIRIKSLKWVLQPLAARAALE